MNFERRRPNDCRPARVGKVHLHSQLLTRQYGFSRIQHAVKRFDDSLSETDKCESEFVVVVVWILNHGSSVSLAIRIGGSAGTAIEPTRACRVYRSPTDGKESRAKYL